MEKFVHHLFVQYWQDSLVLFPISKVSHLLSIHLFESLYSWFRGPFWNERLQRNVLWKFRGNYGKKETSASFQRYVLHNRNSCSKDKIVVVSKGFTAKELKGTSYLGPKREEHVVFKSWRHVRSKLVDNQSSQAKRSSKEKPSSTGIARAIKNDKVNWCYPFWVLFLGSCLNRRLKQGKDNSIKGMNYNFHKLMVELLTNWSQFD